MPSNYILTEPSPSTTSYIRSGRGGAGNTFRTNNRGPSTATSVSHTVPSSSTTANCPTSTANARRFFSGVGGAGNAHKASERPPVSLDDEVRRIAAREEHASAMGHCGIGGAGNVYYRRKASDASDVSASGKEVDDQSSVSSLGSKTNLWTAVRNSLNRD